MVKINNILINSFSFSYINLILIQFLLATPFFAQQDSTLVKIYFNEGNSSLTSQSQEALKKFIVDHTKLRGIRILGRCDTHGDHALNDSLSYKRAKVVSEFLIEQGLTSANIDIVVGLGKRDPIDVHSPHTDSLNRVVWITIAQNFLPVTSSIAAKIISISGADSVVILYPPFDPKYLILQPSPRKGDTLLIDTSLLQKGPILYFKRTIYIAEGLKLVPQEEIKSVALQDSLILILSPYDPKYVIQHKTIRKGDTLQIDTLLRQLDGILYIHRYLFIAQESIPVDFSFGTKEIPVRTTAKLLTQAFLDTLQNSKPGNKIIIRALTFEFGYHVMPTTDLPALEAVVTALKTNPFLKLEIGGHVCCGELDKDVWDKQTNQYDLSVNRAKEVYDYLLTLGADSTRITHRGYGMSAPIVYPEKGKEDQYKNRRIEFLILEK